MPYWGQRFRHRGGTRAVDRSCAFTELEHEALQAGARVAIRPSRRVFEKCGFQWTGVGLSRVRAMASPRRRRSIASASTADLGVAQELAQHPPDHVTMCTAGNLLSRARVLQREDALVGCGLPGLRHNGVGMEGPHAPGARSVSVDRHGGVIDSWQCGLGDTSGYVRERLPGTTGVGR